MWDACLDSTKQVLTVNCVPILINRIIQIGFLFSGTVALLFIIRAGYQYIMSNGDPKQAGAARQTLTYAIIGLIVILLAFLLLNIISTVTGTVCIKTISFNCK